MGECLAFSYVKSEYGFTANEVYLVDYLDEDNLIKNSNKEYYYARPLWQQAFDWFRVKHNIDCWISKIDKEKDKYYWVIDRNNNLAVINNYNYLNLNTYEKTRQACLEKLIEIVEI